MSSSLVRHESRLVLLLAGKIDKIDDGRFAPGLSDESVDLSAMIRGMETQVKQDVTHRVAKALPLRRAI